uniref:RdRp n=1 Tax=Beihai picobirna-like virus 1 TaxID=1922514 RepID=A0A1L3KL83_9VIRU|nr:RdRp [Beihai picobirna-like virus 1]
MKRGWYFSKKGEIMTKQVQKVKETTSMADEIIKQSKPWDTYISAMMPVYVPDGKTSFANLSKITQQEEKYLPLTPYGSNAAKQSKEYQVSDGKDSDSTKMPLDAPVMHWEQNMVDETYELLNKYYDLDHIFTHNKDFMYSDKMSEHELAGVDSASNLVKMGREVTPGSVDRSRENVLQEHEYVFKPDPKLWLMACQMVQQYVGSNSLFADEVFTTKSGGVPFQNYHTNVGHPFYTNDQKILTDGKPVTDHVLAGAKMLELDEMQLLPCVIFGRDQRGGFEYEKTSNGVKIKEFKDSKASVVTGTSSEGNLVMYKVLRPTIEHVQANSFLFSGYLDSNALLDSMLELSDSADKMGLKLVNLDFSKFDTTLSPAMMVEAHSMWAEMFNAKNGKAKDIMDAGLHWSLRMVRLAWLPDLKEGEDFEVRPDEHGFKYTGLKSGIVTTNFMGGLCNALAITYAQLKLYGDASAMMDKLKYRDKLVMGDDDLTWLKETSDKEKLAQMLKDDLGMVINPDKGEDGAFFLQNRVVGNVFQTPSPSVMSKMFWVERPKGLGPYAWTMATWMKLEVILDNPECDDVMSLMAKYDTEKLGTLVSASQFVENLTKESEEEGLTTMERLWDGDPQKVNTFDQESGNASTPWVEKMHARMCEALASGS